MRTLARVAIVAIACAGLGACETTRSILDVGASPGADPASAKAFRIARMTDAREFFVDPPQPDMPSLKDGAIDDDAVTARAIARKRGGFGQPAGDILLPEGDSVADMVETAVVDSLRRHGYSVVDENHPAFADAVPLEVDVLRFWGWPEPGFWHVRLNFVSQVRIQGPQEPFTDGKSIETRSVTETSVPTNDAWLLAVRSHLEQLGADVLATPGSP